MWRVLIYGAALLVLMLWAPHGLAGALAALGGRLGRRVSTATFARPAAASAPPVSGMAVSIERVHKSFGGVAALTDVSLEITARTIPSTACWRGRPIRIWKDRPMAS